MIRAIRISNLHLQFLHLSMDWLIDWLDCLRIYHQWGQFTYQLNHHHSCSSWIVWLDSQNDWSSLELRNLYSSSSSNHRHHHHHHHKQYKLVQSIVAVVITIIKPNQYLVHHHLHYLIPFHIQPHHHYHHHHQWELKNNYEIVPIL